MVICFCELFVVIVRIFEIDQQFIQVQVACFTMFKWRFHDGS